MFILLIDVIFNSYFCSHQYLWCGIWPSHIQAGFPTQAGFVLFIMQFVFDPQMTNSVSGGIRKELEHSLLCAETRGPILLQSE
jgi:hypothetical protein